MTVPDAAGPLPADLLAPEFAEDPFPTYAALSSHAPVHWDAATSCWYLTAYGDVGRLTRSPALSAQIGAAFLGDGAGLAGDVMAFFDLWPMFSDPPAHSAVRGVAAPAYRPKVVDRHREWITAFARQLWQPDVDPDLLHGFVAPLASGVTCRLLGIDAEHAPEVMGWSADIISFIGVPQLDLSRVAATRAAIGNLQDYLACTILPRARAGEGPPQLGMFLELPLPTATALLAQMLTGGIEPVSACLGAALVHLFGPARAVLDALAARAVAADRVTEEALRHDTPFHWIPRTAVTDIEVGGVTIGAGERVALVVAAANRDPSVFAEPAVFRLADDRPHLAFGAGQHFCLGAGLARITIAAALQACAERPPVTGEGVRAEREPAFGHTVWRQIELGA